MGLWNPPIPKLTHFPSPLSLSPCYHHIVNSCICHDVCVAVLVSQSVEGFITVASKHVFHEIHSIQCLSLLKWGNKPVNWCPVLWILSATELNLFEYSSYFHRSFTTVHLTGQDVFIRLIPVFMISSYIVLFSFCLFHSLAYFFLSCILHASAASPSCLSVLAWVSLALPPPARTLCWLDQLFHLNLPWQPQPVA